MIAILDVSVAIEIILKKPAKELFDAHYRNAKWIIAPDLFVSEISDVLWKYYKAKILTHDGALADISKKLNIEVIN